MGKNKKKVCIFCGGKSAEHEVSLQSAYNIFREIDREIYTVCTIAMDKKGKFYFYDLEKEFLMYPNDPENISLKESKREVAFVLGEEKKIIFDLYNKKFIEKIDIIFPIIHGSYGEDGCIQGLLELLNIPYVGSSVIGSAVGMDKDIMKRLLRDSSIDISNFLSYRKNDKIDFNFAKKNLGLPMFIKPASLGSSVGVSKVENKDDFEKAIINAFKYDSKILVEEYIDGREIECAVKGNNAAVASSPGEILPNKEFYSYEAKYIDSQGAGLEIPAKISEKEIEKIKNVAIKVYRILETKGLARVDFFLTKDRLIVNEINTLPGFTKISMYPKLWMNESIAYKELIGELINLAIDEYDNKKKLNRNIK